jgi:hypothetical protein
MAAWNPVAAFAIPHGIYRSEMRLFLMACGGAGA